LGLRDVSVGQIYSLEEKHTQNKDVLETLCRADLLSCRHRRLLSPVSLHIAHANSVLNAPITIVKIPMMRLTFVSVDRLLEGMSSTEGEVVGKGPDKAASSVDQQGCGLCT
jgi:hypothetical protein